MCGKNFVEGELRSWLSKAEKVVVVGIGNPLKSDDFVGVRVVRELKKKLFLNQVLLIECETVPESFMQPIIDFNPSHILLVDAALIGLKPGASKLVDSSQIVSFPAVSTHALPLRIFCEYLEKMIKAKIALLAIQPKSVEFGEGLSVEVEKSAKHLTDILVRILEGVYGKNREEV